MQMNAIQVTEMFYHNWYLVVGCCQLLLLFFVLEQNLLTIWNAANFHSIRFKKYENKLKILLLNRNFTTTTSTSGCDYAMTSEIAGDIGQSIKLNNCMSSWIFLQSLFCNAPQYTQSHGHGLRKSVIGIISQFKFVINHLTLYFRFRAWKETNAKVVKIWATTK